jgi:5-methylcytosine-specific restriction endonuclease McrA
MKIPKKTRIKVWQKHNGLCAYCEESVEYKDMWIDHIIPKRRFDTIAHETGVTYGVDDFKNLNPACRPCNHLKGVWTVEEFRYELFQQVKRGRKGSVNFRTAERFGLIAIINKPVTFYFEKEMKDGRKKHKE